MNDTHSNAIIDQINFEPILAKLCSPERGLRWDKEKAIKAVADYKRWLLLHILYPNETFAPSEELDHVWHCHILDTRKYLSDCSIMFGKGVFLHHNPYAGWESEEAETKHQKVFRRTKELFEDCFGVNLSGKKALCCSGYCDADIDNLIKSEKNGTSIWRPGFKTT